MHPNVHTVRDEIKVKMFVTVTARVEGFGNVLEKLRTIVMLINCPRCVIFCFVCILCVI